MAMVNPAIQDKRAYHKVRPKDGGQWAVFATKAEAEEMVRDCDGEPDDYEFAETWMTPNEFENMREFDGW
jgi:hypothetical protein